MSFIDYFGMIAVFATITFFGYHSMKKANKSDDFLLAGRSLNKLSTALSLSASEFGGSGLTGACAACYTIGIAGAWWNWSAVLPFVLIGIFLAPKLRDLSLCTVPEYLGKRYNTESRVASTAMQIVATIPGIVTQLTVAAVALVTLTGWKYGICITVATGFVLLYTLLGGYMAEVANDVFLFFVIIFAVALTLIFAMRDVGGIAGLKANLPESFFDLRGLGFWEPFSWMLLCLFDYSTHQYIVQRAFSAKNSGTARFAFIFTGGFFIVMGLIVGGIGMVSAVLFPELADANQSYYLLLKNVLPNGILGIALAGIVAATFSTVDSTLISSAMLFVNDIYKPFINKKASEKNLLLVSRLAIVVACLIAMVISHFTNNIIDLIYLAGLFYGAAVFFPLIFGVFCKWVDGTAAFIGMLVAVAVGLYSEFCLYEVVDGIFGMLPSNLVAALSCMVVLVVGSWIKKEKQRRK